MRVSAGVAGVFTPRVVYRRKPKGHHVRATRTRTHTHTWTHPPAENTRNTRSLAGPYTQSRARVIRTSVLRQGLLQKHRQQRLGTL